MTDDNSSVGKVELGIDRPHTMAESDKHLRRTVEGNSGKALHAALTLAVQEKAIEVLISRANETPVGDVAMAIIGFSMSMANGLWQTYLAGFITDENSDEALLAQRDTLYPYLIDMAQKVGPATRQHFIDTVKLERAERKKKEEAGG